MRCPGVEKISSDWLSAKRRDVSAGKRHRQKCLCHIVKSVLRQQAETSCSISGLQLRDDRLCEVLVLLARVVELGGDTQEPLRRRRPRYDRDFDRVFL
jgi:hypothetical protein